MKRPAPPPNGNLKVGGLIGAIVFVFALCYWRIATGSTPPPQAPDLVSPTVSDSQTANAVPVGHELITVPAFSGSPTIDPFRTVLAASAMTAPVGRAQHLAVPVGDIVSIQPLPLGGALPAGAPTGASKVILEPTMILKGVISGGPHGVAVLSIDGKDTVVQPGAVLATGYRVAQVGNLSVTLCKGATSLTLSIAPARS